MIQGEEPERCDDDYFFDFQWSNYSKHNSLDLVYIARFRKTFMVNKNLKIERFMVDKNLKIERFLTDGWDFSLLIESKEVDEYLLHASYEFTLCLLIGFLHEKNFNKIGLLLCHSHIKLRLSWDLSWGWFELEVEVRPNWGWGEVKMRSSWNLVAVELS